MLCLWCETKIDKGTLCSICGDVAAGVSGILRDQLDNLPFGIMHLDRNGKVLAFNHEEAKFSGLSRDDVIGRNFFLEIAPCADTQEFHGRFDAFLRGSNLSEKFEYTYNMKHSSVVVEIIIVKAGQLVFILTKRKDEMETAVPEPYKSPKI